MSENLQTQFNNVQKGKELLPTDREPLLQRAFIVKCIADLTLVLGVLFVILLIFSRTRFGDPQGHLYRNMVDHPDSDSVLHSPFHFRLPQGICRIAR